MSALSRLCVKAKLLLIWISEKIEKAGDKLLVFIVPSNMHNAIRDSGLFREVADWALTAVGMLYGLLTPDIATKFIIHGRNMKVFQYGDTPAHTMQFFQLTPPEKIMSIENEARRNNHNQRVVFFVHGGAWGSGQAWMYRMITIGLGRAVNASSVVTIAYPVFPTASILQQSMCIQQAISFVRENQDKFAIAPSAELILAGHSSGANICALACLHEAQEHARQLVDVFLGFGGVYDVAKHYLFEARRGVHELSPMGAAAGGRGRFDFCSPVKVAKQRFFSPIFFPRTLLIHGLRDTTVPFSSSEEFAEVMENLGVTIQLTRHLYDHVAPLIDLMHVETESQTLEAIRIFGLELVEDVV